MSMRETRCAQGWRRGGAALCLALPMLLASRIPLKAGDSSLQFLRLNAGPREAAMAGAAAAYGAGAYAAAYNPALTAVLRSREAAFSHVSWIEGVQYQDLLYAHPADFGHIGFRFQRLDYGAIPGYDATGARSGDYAASDMLVAANFARVLSPRRGLSMGGNVKLARESIAGASAQAFLLDWGAVFTPKLRGPADLSLGVSARNIGTSVSFDRDSHPVPTELAVGAALSFLDESLVVEADGRFPRNGGPRAAFGGEFSFLDALFLRAGFAFPQDQGPGIHAGFGFRVGKAQVDYAFSPFGDLGQTHHIGARVRFGGPAEESYREGLRLMRLERYSEAILKFNEALRLDPKHSRAGRGLKRAYHLLREVEKQGS